MSQDLTKEHAMQFAALNNEVDLATVSRIGLSTISPVIYTDNYGGGTNEFQAPAQLTTYTLDPPKLPSNAKLVAAWFNFIQGAGPIGVNLDGIVTCYVDVANARQVNLTVSGVNGTNKRVRLQIYGLYTIP